MKVFVIIVTYNGMKWIENCLKSVFNSSLPVEVIVIDNCSTDGTAEFIKNNFKDTLVIKQDKNLGFGAANNIGLKEALNNDGDYFVLLNQDAYLEKETIELLVHQMESNKDYGILSPIHLNGNGNKIDYNFQLYTSPESCKDFYSDIFLKKDLKKIYKVDFVNAAIWLLSKNTLEKVGGFNPYFFHYAEDNDYIKRLKFKNIKIGIVPAAIAYHDRIINNNVNDLKIFVNIHDLKLMNPSNHWTVEKMLKFILKKLFKSIIVMDKSNFNNHYFYLKKTLKNYRLIKNIQKKIQNEDYAFINN